MSTSLARFVSLAAPITGVGVVLGLMLALPVALPVTAQDFQKGYAVFEKGDYCFRHKLLVPGSTD